MKNYFNWTNEPQTKASDLRLLTTNRLITKRTEFNRSGLKDLVSGLKDLVSEADLCMRTTNQNQIKYGIYFEPS